jgi:hypothetical protein
MRRAKSLNEPSDSGKEFTSTVTDFGMLAALARYHAARLRSGQEYQFFAKTGERMRLREAIEHYRKAIGQWEEIARLADRVYYKQMVFNRPPDQIGVWSDELPFLRYDFARLKEIDRLYEEYGDKPAEAAKWQVDRPRYRLMMKWKDSNGTLSRWADETPVAEAHDAPVDRYSMQSPKAVIKDLTHRLRYEKILHVPLRFAPAGAPLPVHASVLGKRDKTKLTLFHRSAGQDYRFTAVEMKEEGPNLYSASLPADRSGERLFYYIRAVDQTSFFHGSGKEPHEVAMQTVPAGKPVIRHDEVRTARVGAAIQIRTEVQAASKPALVRVHYRHLDQSEDWRFVDMRIGSNSRYQATIPAGFVVPGWDVMYAIEAVDESGVGAFYPDHENRDPSWLFL